MSAKRRRKFAEVRSAAIDLAENLRRLVPPWKPNPADPATVSTALAVIVALLRALRARGLLSDGEIDDLFEEAAEHLSAQDDAVLSLIKDRNRRLSQIDTSSAQNLLNRLRSGVERKENE